MSTSNTWWVIVRLRIEIFAAPADGGATISVTPNIDYPKAPGFSHVPDVAENAVLAGPGSANRFFHNPIALLEPTEAFVEGATDACGIANSFHFGPDSPA